MAAQDPFGVAVVLRVAPFSQQQRGLDDVSRIIDLAVVGVGAVAAALDHPADFVANIVEAVVVESPHPLHQGRVVRQVGQLGQ